MAYAKVVFTGGNLGSLELGLDAIDDPGHLDELVKSIHRAVADGRSRGVGVGFALLAGDETAEDLRELVVNLRARQRRAVIASVRDELGADIDEVLDMLAGARGADGRCSLMVAGREATPSDVAATERLMRYWAEGEGAAKIQWGVAGDFARCEVELGKYVSPSVVKGLCANLHHRATGFWPGHAPSEQHQ